jgi:hypothetical protein
LLAHVEAAKLTQFQVSSNREHYQADVQIGALPAWSLLLPTSTAAKCQYVSSSGLATPLRLARRRGNYIKVFGKGRKERDVGLPFSTVQEVVKYIRHRRDLTAPHGAASGAYHELRRAGSMKSETMRCILRCGDC